MLLYGFSFVACFKSNLILIDFFSCFPYLGCCHNMEWTVLLTFLKNTLPAHCTNYSVSEKHQHRTTVKPLN
jgi:hypothetical protein